MVTVNKTLQLHIASWKFHCFVYYSYIGIFYTGHKNNILLKRLVYQAKSDIKKKGINW